MIFAPVWLDEADVKDQMRIDGTDTADDALIGRCCALVEIQAQRTRPSGWVVTDPDTTPPTRVYTPDAEIYQGAVMLAARFIRRRNSPGGVETFADSIAYVARYDPEIASALWLNNWAYPGVA